MSTETDTATADAPYGYHADGVTPRRSNGGRPRGSSTGKRKAPGRAGTAPAPQRKAAANTAPKTSTRRDYTQAFATNISFMGAFLAAKYPLDAYVVLNSANELGAIGNELAGVNKYVRQLGDRALQTGPYAGLVKKLTEIGAQICENHGWLPPQITALAGAVPRDQLIRHIHAEQAAAQAYAASQAPESADPYPADPSMNNGAPFERREPASAYA